MDSESQLNQSSFVALWPICEFMYAPTIALYRVHTQMDDGTASSFSTEFHFTATFRLPRPGHQNQL